MNTPAGEVGVVLCIERLNRYGIKYNVLKEKQNDYNDSSYK